MIRKAVVVFKGGRGTQDLMETKYEAKNLQKIFHIIKSKKLLILCIECL